MAKSIGNLSVILSASTAALTSGLAKAGRQVRNFAGSIGGMSVPNPLASLGGALASGAVVYGLSSTADTMDATAKAADRLGITTEALVGLRHGAKLAGLEAEAFDASITSMSKNVSMSAQGLGKAKIAFSELGLDAKKLNSLEPDLQFKVIAESLKGVANAGDRVKLATQIFGDSKILDFAKEGAQGIEALQIEAENLGLTFSRFDAAKVEAMNDALSRVWQSVTGLAQALVVELAPYVEAAANYFLNMGITGKSACSTILSAVEFVVEAVATIGDVISYVNIGWLAFKTAALAVFEAVLWGINKLAEGVKWLVDTFSFALPQSVVDGTAQITDFLSAYKDEIGRWGDETAGDLSDAWNGKTLGERMRDTFAQIKSDANNAAQAVSDAAPQASEPWSKYIQESVKGTSKITEETKKLKQARQEAVSIGANKAIFATKASLSTIAQSKTNSQLETFNKEQTQLMEDQLNELEQIQQNTASEEIEI